MPSELTLMLARSGLVQERLDVLIDARPVSAASIIRRLPEDDAKALLLAAVSSVGERYRFPTGPPETPEARATALTERTRRVARDVLAEHPEALVPLLLAAGDALDTLNRSKDTTTD